MKNDTGPSPSKYHLNESARVFKFDDPSMDKDVNDVKSPIVGAKNGSDDDL